MQLSINELITLLILRRVLPYRLGEEIKFYLGLF